MNKELGTKWCAALRSGKYQQGMGTLRQGVNLEGGPKFCCLGVLVQEDLVPEYIPDSTEDEERNLLSVTNKEFQLLRRGNLDSEQREALEITLKDQEKFINLNDQERLTFEEIAGFIEENYLKEYPNANA